MFTERLIDLSLIGLLTLLVVFLYSVVLMCICVKDGASGGVVESSVGVLPTYNYGSYDGKASWLFVDTPACNHGVQTSLLEAVVVL